jgi:hypothetical protein
VSRLLSLLFIINVALSPAVFAQDDVQTILEREMARTAPDYVTYRPGSVDGSTFDTGNEHFLVFDGPDRSLMAVWTQSSHENAGDHRIVFARSDDDGKTWSTPVRIAGPERPTTEERIASWGFPLVSKSGRIYVLYNRESLPHDYARAMTGVMEGRYSDDHGATWSKPEVVPMPRSPWDHPDPQYAANWIVWQRPERNARGRYYVGYTHWVSPVVRTPPHTKSWTAAESVVSFMQFENIDDNPSVKDIAITYIHKDDDALRVPHYSNPDLSIAQEPSIVYLPDGRLFCTMRTMSGYIWYTLSEDDGGSWCAPRPLLRKDRGEVIQQPLCCCPIYRYDDTRYVLLHHNNDGQFEDSKREDTNKNRRPAFIALGEYRPDAEQPIWFSESKEFMDNDGHGIGPLNRIDIGVYPSVTRRNNEFVLWHPDRKFFLLGKVISGNWLGDLTVPSS